MVKLGQTDSGQNVKVGVFGGTNKVNWVGPMCKGQGKTSTRFDRLHKLGETDFGNKQNRELVKQTRWDRLHNFCETKIIAMDNKEIARPSW